MRKLTIAGLALLLGGCGGKSTGELVEQLKSKEATDRLHAVHALSAKRAEAVVVVPALTATLKDADPFVRRDAALALAKLGPEAQAALAALQPLLKDRNQGVRKAAAKAVQAIDPQAVISK